MPTVGQQPLLPHICWQNGHHCNRMPWIVRQHLKPIYSDSAHHITSQHSTAQHSTAGQFYTMKQAHFVLMSLSRCSCQNSIAGQMALIKKHNQTQCTLDDNYANGRCVVTERGMHPKVGQCGVNLRIALLKHMLPGFASKPMYAKLPGYLRQESLLLTPEPRPLRLS